MPVEIHYFPIRGRAEVMKLLCAYGKEPFTVVNPDYATMKTDLDAFPFAQCPKLVDGDVNVSQSNACIRHLARKLKLYGKDEADMAMVDMLLDGVEDLRAKYIPLIYVGKLEPDAKKAYWATHGDKANVSQRNGGAHFEFLERLLRKAGGKWFVGGSPTAADLAVFDVVHLHLRPALFPDEMRAAYPGLVAHHDAVGALEGVREYRASPLCLKRINNSDLG